MFFYLIWNVWVAGGRGLTRAGARFAREKQVPRCARNDSQKGKGNDKGKGNSKGKGNNKRRLPAGMTNKRATATMPVGRLVFEEGGLGAQGAGAFGDDDGLGVKELLHAGGGELATIAALLDATEG